MSPLSGAPDHGSRAPPIPVLSRRRWLRFALGAGGAIVAGAGGAWLWVRGDAPDVEGLAIVDAHEHRTLAKLVEVAFPARGPIPVDVAALDLPRAFDAFLAGEPEDRASDLKRALFLIEIGPLVYERRATTFSRLGARERERHWRAWLASDDLLRRQIAGAFQKVLSLMFYDRPEVWPHIGYGGPSLWGAGSGGR